MRPLFLRLLGLAAAAVVAIPPAYPHPHSGCVGAGEWIVPGANVVAAWEVLSQAATESVVLLGEHHDNADHHLWQLQTAAALAALRGKVVLGFEMFPRRVQPALDRWVAGELSEKEFLAAADWARVWAIDARLYLPLFHFARLNKIPMVALNVERAFTRAVRARGLDSVAPKEREGVSAAEPASQAYLDRLYAVYLEHLPHAQKGTRPAGTRPARDDPAFLRFVQGQLVWDRAFAQALAERSAREPEALVIGIMGSGHIIHGHGVEHQLRSLGVTNVAALIPWDASAQCGELPSGLATAVFGVPAALPALAAPPRRLLGISIETVPDGVRVKSVNPGSVAEVAGLRVQDVIVEAAGAPVKGSAALQSAVQSAAPGVWLPLKARRQGETIELVAKFPAVDSPAVNSPAVK